MKEELDTKYSISVLSSVYKNDKAEYVRQAFDSILNQTYSPKQIVIVRDGPVAEELQVLLDEYKTNPIFTVIEHENNIGLGQTLNEGSKFCKYDYIARMDSDDISLPTRFEKQIKCFIEDADLSMVGTNGIEFVNSIENVAGVKAVPQNDADIKKMMKSRCPFCHMSVIMKKQVLLDAGGYQDWYYAEDWYLWIRMALAGAKFKNLQENLVQIRINDDTYARRHGLKYFKSIKNLLKYMKQHKMISFCEYIKSTTQRFIGHVLVPKSLKAKLYKRFMRKKLKDEKTNQ